MRKREAVLLLALSLLLLLSGCAEAMESAAKWESGIYDDERYREYREALDNGEVVEDGEYSGYSAEAAEFLAQKEQDAIEKGVRVTFADNSKLSARWYTDKERACPIDGDGAVLPAGTAIYADVAVTSESVSDRYVFGGFRVMTYSAGGVVETTEENVSSDGFVCVVPSDAAVEAISILPMGRYDDRILTLKAVRITPEGDSETFPGQWKVNSESVSSGSVRISSASEYLVEYDYAALAEDYYLVRGGASPAVASDENGIVTFFRQRQRGGAESFSLTFQPYIRMTIHNGNYKWLLEDDIIVGVAVNGDDLEDVKVKSDKIELGDKFRCGDEITIRVKNGYEVWAEGLAVFGPVETDGGRTAEYSVTVPESFNGISASIEVGEKRSVLSIPEVPDATVSVLADGHAAKDGDYYADSTQISVYIRPKPGYYVSGKGVSGDEYHTGKMDFDDYRAEIDSIMAEHPVKSYIKLTLPEGDEWGEFTFELDGQTVSGRQDFQEGAKLKWTYTVTKAGYRISGFRIGGKTKERGTLEITPGLAGLSLTHEFLGVDVVYEEGSEKNET